MRDSTDRFSTRVEAYVKYRPSYPPETFDTLREACGWTADAVVADIGSGTGICSELFLRQGNRVYGVEPNREMRQAAERLLAGYAGFASVDGRAEATGLATASIDFVVAAQAFHWFDRQTCRREFARILRPRGFVLVLWNERLVDVSPFSRAYESLLRAQSIDYAAVNHADAISEAVIAEFFHPHTFGSQTFPNRQDFDLNGLVGRALSSSYVPPPGDPRHEGFFSELARVFHTHADAGTVSFDYATRLYWGRLT